MTNGRATCDAQKGTAESVLVATPSDYERPGIRQAVTGLLQAASFALEVQSSPARPERPLAGGVVVDGWGRLTLQEAAAAGRTIAPTTPLIAVASGEDAVADLLEAGFADACRWPLGEGELVARVRARMWHARRLPVDAIFMDAERLTIRCNRVHTTLTPGEFRLLQLLVESPGRWISSKVLLEQSLGCSRVGATRVAARIHEIRKKLLHEAWRLRGHRTLGYLFEAVSPLQGAVPQHGKGRSLTEESL